MKMNKKDINHEYTKIVPDNYNDFLYINPEDKIFDEFGNYKMPNYFESIEINSAIQKHK